MAAATRGLIVPGLNGSGPEHWQTLWEKKYGFDRVRQQDWGNPDAHEWIETLDRTIVSIPEQILIVAHSLGCLTVAQWSGFHPEHAGRVRAALLVAPPDLTASKPVQDAARGFVTNHTTPLPFPSIFVGSENDPHMTLSAAQRLAEVLQSRFINAGRVGHINVDSGHGPWPEGEVLLEELIAAVSRT